MEDQQTSNLKNLRIQHQFFQLQHHWNHYKASSKPDLQSPTMLRNDSPPKHDLISSLQRHGTATFSTSSGWKIHTNELAQDEIRRERRAAIASRQLRGRRLSYDDIDQGNDFLHGSYCNDLHDHIHDQPFQSSDSGEDYTENRNREFGRRKEEQVPVCLNGLSYASALSSSSSSLMGKKAKEQMAMAMAAKVEENVTTTVVGEKIETRNWCKLGKWELGLALLAIASVSVVLLISSVCCLGFGAYDEEQLPFLLVPT